MEAHSCPRCGSKLGGLGEAFGEMCPRCLMAGVVQEWPETALAENAKGVLAGRSVGKYEIQDLLGSGAMGAVYRATHSGLDRPVAIKILSAPGNESALERFQREAQVAANLQHPNIVGIHDVGSVGSLHYIAMDLVEGESLRSWIAHRRPDAGELLTLMEKVAKAVMHAHQHGVIHRDLKPENILVKEDGEPVVVDFGLARPMHEIQLTKEGMLVGTPAYMAPEQVRGEVSELDARTDVYSLGVILYEAVTGELPYLGRTEAEIYQRILESEAVPPSHIRPETTTDLDTIILKSMEKEPGHRYRNAGALAEDLRRCAGGEPITARPLNLFARQWRRLKRRPWIAAAILAAGLLIGIGAFLVQLGNRENQRLQYALDVQAAWSELESRLQKSLREADAVRYDPGLATKRASLLANIDRIVEQSGDDTGVGDAYRAWARLLLEEEDAESFYQEATARHPDNPFFRIMHARFNLRRYAEHARFHDAFITLHPIRNPVQSLSPLESEPMKRFLDHARKDLREAEESPIWRRVPDLKWVVELTRGFAAYAEGDFNRSITILSGLEHHEEFTVEANLIIALSYCRRNEPGPALRHAKELDAQRPGLRPVLTALSACHRFVGAGRLSRGEDGIPNLLEARRIELEHNADPLRNPAVPSIELMIAHGYARLGRMADAMNAMRNTASMYRKVVEAMPDNSRARTNYAIALGGLAEYQPGTPEGEAHAESAEVQIAEARRRSPDDLNILMADAEIRIVRLRFMARKGESVDEIVGPIERDLARLEEHGHLPVQIWFTRSHLEIFKGTALLNRGKPAAEPFRRAQAYARKVLEVNPYPMARYVVVWMPMMIALEESPSADRVMEIAEEADRFLEVDGAWRKPFRNYIPWWLRRMSNRFGGDEAKQIVSQLVRSWTRLVEAEPESYDIRKGHADATLDLMMLDQKDAHLRGPEAQARYQELIRRWPDRPEGYAGIARVYTLMAGVYRDRPEKLRELMNLAMAAARKALALDKNHVPAMLVTARLLAAAKRINDAEKVVDRILSLDPKNGEGRVRRMTLLLMRGRLEEALQIMESSRLLIGGDRSAWQEAMQLAGSAIQFHDGQISRNPGDAGPLIFRARWRLVRGEKEMARADLEQARTRNASPEQKRQIEKLLRSLP